jgi:hypothetical protein
MGLNIYSNAQMKTAKAVDESKISVDELTTTMAMSLDLQKERAKNMEDVPSQVRAIQQHLK